MNTERDTRLYSIVNSRVWKIRLWGSKNRNRIRSIQDREIRILEEEKENMRDKTDRERDRDRGKERCIKEILRPVVMEEDSTTL